MTLTWAHFPIKLGINTRLLVFSAVLSAYLGQICRSRALGKKPVIMPEAD